MMGMDMFNLAGTGQYGDSNTNQIQQLQFVLQTLLAANPQYLTGGIPNKILSQFVMAGGAEAKVKPTFVVCVRIIILLFNIF